jgi:hypothetical protein
MSFRVECRHAPDPIGAQKGSPYARSILDLSCDLHDELATLLRKTIFEDEGRRSCTRLGTSQTPMSQGWSAEGLLHLSPDHEHDLRAHRPRGRAVSGNTNLVVYASLASAATAQQSLPLKRLEPQFAQCQPLLRELRLGSVQSSPLR